MEGTAPGGRYRVPVTLLYPLSRGNGVGLLDVLNNANLVYAGVPEGTPLARLQLGDDFIMRRGYSYMTVQFEKIAAEVTGQGYIQAGTDGYTILTDAAAFVRSPCGRIDGMQGQPRPPVSQRVLAYGFSRSGAFLRGYVARNTDRRIDGFLIGGVGAISLQLTHTAPYALIDWDSVDTPAPLARNGKVIMINGETDLQVFRGPEARGPDEVVYEFPGIAHIPGSFYDLRLVPVDLSSLGVTLEQNPVSFGPALRGAVANLTSWVVDRVPPPPSVAIAGGEPSPAITFFPPYSFAEGVEFSRVYFAPNRDADGNARGGVRLPHIAVPLGTYGGYDADPVAAYLPFFGAAVFLGGKFTPFPDSVLRQRYPNHGAYVRAVAHAANEALRNRWITEEDRDGYVTEAARSRVGK
jgi:hypothetical protein